MRVCVPSILSLLPFFFFFRGARVGVPRWRETRGKRPRRVGQASGGMGVPSGEKALGPMRRTCATRSSGDA